MASIDASTIDQRISEDFSSKAKIEVEFKPAMNRISSGTMRRVTNNMALRRVTEADSVGRFSCMGIVSEPKGDLGQIVANPSKTVDHFMNHRLLSLEPTKR